MTLLAAAAATTQPLPLNHHQPPSLTVSVVSPAEVPQTPLPQAAGSSAAPGGSPMSKLKVPTPLLAADNTPTPVRNLLREAEASGIFGQVASAAAAPNPFDDQFRRAAAANMTSSSSPSVASSSVKTPSASATTASGAEDEETLNTPQIYDPLQLEQEEQERQKEQRRRQEEEKKTSVSAARTPHLRPLAAKPKHASTLPGPALVLRQSSTTSSSTPVLLAPPPKSTPTQSQEQQQQQARLIIQLPNGGSALHLSDIPVVNPQAQQQQQQQNPPLIAPTVVPPPRKRPPPPPSKPADDHEGAEADDPGGGNADVMVEDKRMQLLERNRAAAHRSRLKKKARAEESGEVFLKTFLRKILNSS